MTYYNVKTKHSLAKEGGETGDIIRVVRTYLVASDSVTGAEAKILEWMPDNYKEAVVESATKSNIVEVFKHGESDNYFMAKVGDQTEDDKGKVKVNYFFILVNGEDVPDAASNLKENYQGNTNSYVISAVGVTTLQYDEDLADDAPAKRVPGKTILSENAKEWLKRHDLTPDTVVGYLRKSYALKSEDEVFCTKNKVGYIRKTEF